MKKLLQDSCLFLGSTLIFTSLFFVILSEPVWCFDVGYILFSCGSILIVMSELHKMIFGG